jgi:hypothetical protein
MYGFWVEIPRSALGGLAPHRVSVSAAAADGRAATLGWFRSGRGLLASLDEARDAAWSTTRIVFENGEVLSLQTASEGWDVPASAKAAEHGESSARPVDQSVGGWIDAIQRDDEHLVVRGWAVDHSRAAPAKRALLVSDSRVVAATGLGLDRADVAQQLARDSLRGCGFQLTVPRRVLEGTSLPDVRVMAVGEDGRMGLLASTQRST